MSIGARVRQVRQELGISQEELAKKVGIKQPTLSALETGGSKGTANIATLAAALGVSALWLQTGKGPKSATPNYRPEPLRKDQLATMLTQEVLELVALYAESSAEWRGKIMDFARIAAVNSKNPEAS